MFLGGVPGKLARDNVTRNPGRTASTAAALMIGLALVTFVAVLASGLTKTVEKAIDDQVATDYVLVSENGFTPFEPGVDTALATDASLTVSPVRGENVRAIIVEADGVNETDAQLSGVDPATVSSVYRFDWVSGSDALVQTLGSDEAVIERDFANDNGLGVGDQFSVQASSGAAVEVTAVGIYDAPAILGMLGDIAVPIATFDALIDGPRNLYTFVRVEGGATPAATDSLESALAAGFPGIELDTQQEFKDRNEENISQFLNLLFVLLALSVVVSLFGMVNTLILSVFERTRELGMLRAVGMTRRQARRMIRHELKLLALA